MTDQSLPAQSADVVSIPEGDIPEMIRTMVRRKKFSALVSGIHTEARSRDPEIKRQAVLALKRLGFVE